MILLNYPKINEHLTKWNTDKSDIPNQHNYLLVVMMKSGLQYVTRVTCINNFHSLERAEISDVEKWRPLDIRDKQIINSLLGGLEQPLNAVCEVLTSQDKDIYAESLTDIYLIALTNV